MALSSLGKFEHEVARSALDKCRELGTSYLLLSGRCKSKVPLQEYAGDKDLAVGPSLTAEKIKECLWITPKLICQVAFVEWMDAELLRHRTFVAMRDDKKPAEVVRET